MHRISRLRRCNCWSAPLLFADGIDRFTHGVAKMTCTLDKISTMCKFELLHVKTNKVACAPSEDSDQPGHPPSLIRVFTCAQRVAQDPNFLQADSEDTDQTGQMPKLIWVFARRTCHFVGFVMRWLICCFTLYLNLTHISLASHFWDIGKQCRPRSDATEQEYLFEID